MPGSGLCDSDQIALWNLGPSCVGLHYGTTCICRNVFGRLSLLLLAITRLHRRLGQKSSPQNNPAMSLKATSKWPTAIPLLAPASLSVIILGDSAKPIFVFVCKHNSQELMIGANYLKHVLQFYLTT